MNFIKQSTAVILKLGPFVDDTDFKTAETGLTIAQGDIQISKNGGAFAQTSAASPTTTHDADGWYPIPLTTTDTGTLGHIMVQVLVSGALPVWWEGLVLPANVYDALVAGSDYLQVDAVQVEGGDATDALGTAQTGDTYARLGAPAGASVSADVAAVKAQTAAIETDTQDIQTKLGAPAGASVSADVAAVKAQTAAIETDTQDIQIKIGTPSVSLAADIAGVSAPTETEVAAEVDSVLTAAHGSGAWTSGVAGSGDTEVNSSSLDDESDTMVFQTSGGAGIGGATVRAYVKTEYDAGTYTVRATATTEDDGTWGPIYLNDGVQYTITFFKPGYAVATTTITVGA
jgi:hypothetical protein